MKKYTKEEFSKKWPMDEIPDCIRECAVAWATPSKLFIEDTVKLARDMLEATEKYRLEYAKQECVKLLDFLYASAVETIPKITQKEFMWLLDLSVKLKDSKELYEYYHSKNTNQ
jgi:hypothetical protein